MGAPSPGSRSKILSSGTRREFSNGRRQGLEALDTLRKADAIYLDEIRRADLHNFILAETSF